MSEFRVTYPLSISSFDIFHPSWFLPNILPHIVCKQVESSEKEKIDEYLLIQSNKYNVKFTGPEGKSFDIKELVNFQCNAELDIEEWKGLCKGDLDGNGTDFLVKKLIELSEKNENNCQKLLEVINLLSTAQCERIITKKNLSTMKCQIEKSQVFMVEQIDFSMWNAQYTKKRLMLRSISLEGTVPKGMIEKTLMALKKKYGDNLIFGGFPTMLQKAIKISTDDGKELVFECL